LAQLPDRLRNDPLVQKVKSDIDSIQKMVSYPADHVPTVDEVKQLNAAASKLTKEIASTE
jgi:hypothetical protein